jgi:hypothetical protein
MSPRVYLGERSRSALACSSNATPLVATRQDVPLGPIVEGVLHGWWYGYAYTSVSRALWRAPELRDAAIYWSGLEDERDELGGAKHAFSTDEMKAGEMPTSEFHSTWTTRGQSSAAPFSPQRDGGVKVVGVLPSAASRRLHDGGATIEMFFWGGRDGTLGGAVPCATSTKRKRPAAGRSHCVLASRRRRAEEEYLAVRT